MKTLRFLVALLLVTLCTGFYSCSKENDNEDDTNWGTVVTLTVNQAGSLNQLIPDNKKMSIEQLTLMGTLNKADFETMSSMIKSGILTMVNLSSATIDNQAIPSTAFRDCSNLRTIILPNNITSIGKYAFGDCSSIVSINIPNSVTSIEDCAFYGCTGLKSIEISNKVTQINTQTFWGCTGLTSIAIPSNVTQIKFEAFAGCKGLTSINIPGKVTLLEKSAFAGCTSIMKLTFEDGISNLKIGDDDTYNTVFSGCPLEEVYLGRNLTRTNQLEYLTSALFMDKTTLKKITISGAGTKVEPLAFTYCEGLNNVVIGNGVTTIGNGAFSQPTITSITLGNSVENIDNSAFYRCNITSIQIPSTVKRIGNSAFYECMNLKDIYVQAVTPPTIYDDTFGLVDKDNCKLHVLESSQEKYQNNSHWSKFQTIMAN